MFGHISIALQKGIYIIDFEIGKKGYFFYIIQYRLFDVRFIIREPEVFTIIWEVIQY